MASRNRVHKWPVDQDLLAFGQDRLVGDVPAARSPSATEHGQNAAPGSFERTAPCIGGTTDPGPRPDNDPGAIGFEVLPFEPELVTGKTRTGC